MKVPPKRFISRMLDPEDDGTLIREDAGTTIPITQRHIPEVP
jgi:hypothetical protein